MTKPLSDRLYNLLPALYRLRDAEPEQGQALRALMALIEQQFLEIEADVDQLYDDWFIETCQEWVVPYIGELLAVRPLQPINPKVVSQRAYVANTLGYRQSKGTAAVLEQLGRDVTLWPTRAVEFFQRLVTTENLNHLRSQPRTPDLRRASALELTGSPFEITQHLPEVRRIASERGRYNLPNVGLMLWRLQSYPLAQVEALAAGEGRYWVNPLGRDLALFNTPNPEVRLDQIAAEVNVPGPLRRRPLYDEVKARAAGQVPATDYFDATPPLRVWRVNTVDGELQADAVPPEDLRICDLSGESWERPAGDRAMAVDPVLGRLAVPADSEIPEAVWMSYAYGFSGDIGGGPYDRRDSLDADFLERLDWQAGVSRQEGAVGDELMFEDLGVAIATWNDQPPGTRGLITLMDNLSYTTGTSDAVPLVIPEGSELLIVAADWPARLIPGSGGARQRIPGRISPIDRRAHIADALVVQGLAPSDSPQAGRLMVNGLLLEGALRVRPGHLGRLELDHATLVPSGGLQVEPGTENSANLTLEVTLRSCLSGPVYVASTTTCLTVADSILDATEAGHIVVSQPVQLPVNGTLQWLSGEGSGEISVNAADMDAARDQLAATLPAFDVAHFDDRLIVTGELGTSLSFEATASDSDTVERLGLDVAAAALASPEAAAPAPPTVVERSTLLGGLYVQTMELGSEAIFAAPAYAQRRQRGCVRFSYVAPGSALPRRYRCQPELAVSRELERVALAQGAAAAAAQEAAIIRRLRQQLVPVFTSTAYGEAAYGQLSRRCPSEIRTGAEDGSEMGAFSFLKQPQREANLRLALDEYLRFGLAAGLFFIT